MSQGNYTKLVLRTVHALIHWLLPVDGGRGVGHPQGIFTGSVYQIANRNTEHRRLWDRSAHPRVNEWIDYVEQLA